MLGHVDFKNTIRNESVPEANVFPEGNLDVGTTITP